MSPLAAVQSEEDGLSSLFGSLSDIRDTRYVTHGIHPYPAKFIPQIPRALIEAFSDPGDLVWDPMCGSGTTLVEAMLTGRQAVGGDLNPISVLVSSAKTTLLSDRELAELSTLAGELVGAAQSRCVSPPPIPDFPNRDHWFEPLVSAELAVALQMIDSLQSPRSIAFARCAFSAIVVPVSNQESETRWSARRSPIEPGRVFLRLSKRLLDSALRIRELAVKCKTRSMVHLEDARRTSVSPRSVRLAVTSPPYANSHDYYLYNKLRMFWLGYGVREVQEAEIGSRNRHSDKGEPVESYLEAMAEVMAEVHDKLAETGHLAMVVGDAVIRKEFFDMGVLLTDVASTVGFTPKRRFAFDHRRFNSAFQRGFGTKQDKQTHVLIFQRR